MVRKEFIKQYHTPSVGTTYHVVVEDSFISLEALEKPYKIIVSIKDLLSLLK